jgi:hypothetical protein
VRLACKILAIPALLIVASGIGLLGSWGMPVGAVLMFVACVVAAVAMESQDLATVEGLTPAAAPVESVPEPMLEAA